LPHAFIGWAVEERAAGVLEEHPALDRLFRVPRGWIKSPTAIARLRRELKGEGFDVSIDLQGLTKSAVAARLSGAPRRIGAGGRDGRELSKWFNNELTPIRARHVIDHYLGLLRPLGILEPEVEFGLPDWPIAAREMDDYLSGAGLLPGGFAIVNPGASWASKQWPAGRFGEVAVFLGRRLALPTVVVWAGDQERELAEKIVETSGGWGRLAPRTSIHELAELARRAAVVISSDTGPLHLAVAIGTPSVSLHGTTRAAWSGAYGPSNLSLQAYYDGGSSKHRRRADNRAMRAISVETVCQACARLLLASRSSAPMSLAAA
jgi:ADP-heptose:LPS heptosyltransferase